MAGLQDAETFAAKQTFRRWRHQLREIENKQIDESALEKFCDDVCNCETNEEKSHMMSKHSSWLEVCRAIGIDYRATNNGAMSSIAKKLRQSFPVKEERN